MIKITYKIDYGKKMGNVEQIILGRWVGTPGWNKI